MADAIGIVNGSFSKILNDGTSGFYREFHLGANSASPGASGATITALNGVISYKLDAINEYIYVSSDIHHDWDGSSDIEVNINGYLTNAETANDLIRMSVRADYYGDHENANTAKTQTITTDHDIGAFNAQFSVHDIPFVIPWDTGGNVVEEGDMLHTRIWLDDITTAPVVTAFNICHITIKYKTTNPAIEV